MDREETIRGLNQGHFDLLVIGGGATGSGIALDAASRGLKVALVEKEDFGSGTSARSTKLIHGGVRYLEKAVKGLDRGQFNLVRDALRERAAVLKIAPHLSWRLPLVIPLYRAMEVPYFWLGLKMYDALAGQANLTPSRFLSASATLRRLPMLRPDGLIGGMLYYDGQFDDARLNVALALTANEHGAAILNHAATTELIRSGGRLVGAIVRGVLENQEWEIRAHTVINATGPFSDEIRKMDDPRARPILRVSSGMHIVLDGEFVSTQTGVLIPKTEDGRVLFILPWLSHTIVGTTDSPADPSYHPPVLDDEIEYLLRHVNSYSAEPVTADHVKAAWVGLRPLVADPETDTTAKLSRDHVIVESPSGLITIAGGKWTTYRKMAQDTVDHALKRAGITASRECWTKQIPLVGGAHYNPQLATALQSTHGLDFEVAAHLSRAYGDRAELVAAIAHGGLGSRLVTGHPNIEAEVVWAARAELAQTPLDVLARRTRIAFLDRRAAIAALPRVVGLMAGELSWDADRREREDRESRDRLEHAI